MKRICMKKLFLPAFAMVMMIAILSCSPDSGDGGEDKNEGGNSIVDNISSDEGTGSDATDENSGKKTDVVELSIQNDSSYDLTDVSWRGIAFYSSTDGKTIPSGSVAKNKMEKDAGGYVFFTRNGVVPAKLRSVKYVAAAEYIDKGYRITDDTKVTEVGNTENIGCLSNIIPSSLDYYTVSFESNGGAYIEPYTVQCGKEIAVVTEMQKDGAAFAGWFLDKDFNQKVEFPYMPESDAVLYAEWKSPPESVSCTSTRISSSCVEIQITPSDDKYFDCYRVVCYKSVTSRVARVTTRNPSSKELFLDVKTKDSSYKINGPEGTYLINLYVIDMFGQQSKAYAATIW